MGLRSKLGDIHVAIAVEGDYKWPRTPSANLFIFRNHQNASPPKRVIVIDHQSQYLLTGQALLARREFKFPIYPYAVRWSLHVFVDGRT